MPTRPDIVATSVAIASGAMLVAWACSGSLVPFLAFVLGAGIFAGRLLATSGRPLLKPGGWDRARHRLREGVRRRRLGYYKDEPPKGGWR